MLTPVSCLVVDDDEAMVDMWRGLLAPWDVRRLSLAEQCPAASAHEELADALDGSGPCPDIVLVRADLASRGGEDTPRGRRDWAGLSLAESLQANRDHRVPVVLYGVHLPIRALDGLPFVRLPDECGRARNLLEGRLPTVRCGPTPLVSPVLQERVDEVSRCLARIGPGFLSLCDARGDDAFPTLDARGRAFWEGSDWKSLCDACQALRRSRKALAASEAQGFRLPDGIMEVHERLGALEWALPLQEPARLPEILAQYRERYLTSSRIVAAWTRAEAIQAAAAGEEES